MGTYREVTRYRERDCEDIGKVVADIRPRIEADDYLVIIGEEQQTTWRCVEAPLNRNGGVWKFVVVNGGRRMTIGEDGTLIADPPEA